MAEFQDIRDKEISNKQTATCLHIGEGMSLTFSRDVQEAEVRTGTARAWVQVFFKAQQHGTMLNNVRTKCVTMPDNATMLAMHLPGAGFAL